MFIAASRRGARFLPLLAALVVPFPASASAPTEQAPGQPADAQPTLSLTLEVTAKELRFDAGPNLSVSPGPLADTCQFASGVTYQDVHLRLEVTDTTATLACGLAGADEPAIEAPEPTRAPEPAG